VTDDFQDQFVEILAPMIEPKLTLFKMQVEGRWAHSSETNQTGLGVAPETFNTVDVRSTLSEFVLAMIDAQVLAITNVDQTIVATPAVGVDHTLQLDSPPDNRLESGFGAIGNDFGIDVTVPLKDAKDDRFSKSTAPSFALDAAGTEERFVHFNLSRKGRLGSAIIGKSLSNCFQITVNGIATQTRETGYLRGVQINRKQAHNLPKLMLRNA